MKPHDLIRILLDLPPAEDIQFGLMAGGRFVPLETAAKPGSNRKSSPLYGRIQAYLTKHGPAALAQIAQGLGESRSGHLQSVLKRGERDQLWASNGKGRGSLVTWSIKG